MPTLGVIGTRPYTVKDRHNRYGFDKTHDGVRWFHETHGMDRLISGLAMGVEQWAAAAAMRWRMTLVAALPFPAEHLSSGWDDQAREAYHSLLASAHEVQCMAASFSIAAYGERNQWLVDNADQMLIVSNGKRRGGTWDCIRRTIMADRPGVLVHTGRERVLPFANGQELCIHLGLIPATIAA